MSARLARSVIASLLVALVSTPVSSSAATIRPSVRLFAPVSSISVDRLPGDPVWLDPGIYVASVGGPFEIRAWRTDYDHSIQAAQAYFQNGLPQLAPLPSALVRDFNGLPGFFTVRVARPDGRLVTSLSAPFCPAGPDARIDQSGPFNPTYPRFCATSPFTLGSVWGIDRGWAVSGFGFGTIQLSVPDGSYRVSVSVSPEFRSFFGIGARDASASIKLVVKSSTPCKISCPPGPKRVVPADRASRPALGTAPTTPAPSPDTLPDLVALPAWNVQTSTDAGRDYLQFAATVWNAGPAPMVVEGYRRGSAPVMDAWQYFFRNGQVTGRARAGQLLYDPRPGHQHWHFKQFASYALRDAAGQRVLSQKEAFCLAPTDPIDLLVRGADWNPFATGLMSACGDLHSIWSRESLPAAWGDTYYQSTPGQSFDITSLPNGTYQIAVQANPTGLLFERSRSNNTSLRTVVIGGVPGARTVVALPWHGISA